jgi:hypothetical protein
MVLDYTLHSCGHYQVTAYFHHQGVWAYTRAGRLFKTMDAACRYATKLREKGRGACKGVKISNLNTGRVYQITKE